MRKMLLLHHRDSQMKSDCSEDILFHVFVRATRPSRTFGSALSMTRSEVGNSSVRPTIKKSSLCFSLLSRTYAVMVRRNIRGRTANQSKL